MSWNTIKLDKADTLFSYFIRLRDTACARCGRSGRPDSFGNCIIGLQCSHYWSRRNESVRFAPENCDALCAGCHRIWGGEGREQYREYKMSQLGEDGYNKLEISKNMYQKRDRVSALLYVRELLKTVVGGESYL